MTVAQEFCLRHQTHTRLQDHLVPYPTDSGLSFPLTEAAGVFRCSTLVKNIQTNTNTSLQTIILWCLTYILVGWVFKFWHMIHDKKLLLEQQKMKL